MKDANFCIHEISKTLSGKISKYLPVLVNFEFVESCNISIQSIGAG